MEVDIGKRHQTLLVLWFAMLMNMGVLFAVAFIAAPEVSKEAAGSTNTIITSVLGAVCAFIVVTSYAVKRKFLERSVDKQDVSIVQKGFILAWAMCEVSALMGLLEKFLIGNRDYYILFLLAVIGIALHFPRAEHLRSASFNSSASAGSSS
jgi:hypothetical protein